MNDNDDDYDYEEPDINNVGDAAAGPRQTSQAAYDAIKASGLLSRKRWLTYDITFLRGPMTGNEVGEVAKRDHGDRTVRHNYNARCGELRDIGVLREVGSKKCSVTGFEAILWDVTDFVPSEIRRNRPTWIKLKMPIPFARLAVEEILRLTAAGLVKRSELVQLGVLLQTEIKKRDRVGDV